MSDKNNSLMDMENIKWGVRRRLEFIDFRLLWDGKFNRKDLSDVFNISTQQASADIGQYETLFPKNLNYDKNLKSYVREMGFAPQLIEKSTDRYLLQLMGIANEFINKEDTWFDKIPPVDIVSIRQKTTNSNHLQFILDAIRNKLELTIEYHSMSGKSDTKRNIMPHSLAYSSGRWHARAWCREHNNFRDFNLNRILSVSNLRESEDRSSCDAEWHDITHLILAPNPRLSKEKQMAVRMEYSMQDEQIIIPIRVSLVFYLINEYNLDVKPENIKTDKQQLILLNSVSIEKAKEQAEQKTLELLKKYAV